MAYPDYIDYYMAIERGLDNHSSVHKFGRQTDLSTTMQTIWSRNKPYSYLASSSNLIIASDRDTDKAAGSGALTAVIYGVDNDFNAINEQVTLTGFAAASTTADFRRVFRIVVNSAGSNGFNNGRLTVLPDIAANTFTAAGVPTSTANVICQVDSTTNQTLMAMYTVPASQTAYMTGFHLGASGSRVVTSELYVRPFGETFQIKNSYVLNTDSLAIFNQPPFKIASKSDIEFRAKSSSSAGIISASFDLVLTNNDN